MPAARRDSRNTLIISSAAVTIAFGVFSFVWSVIEGQISELRNDFIKYQTEARWNFANKDYVNGKIEGIKEEQKTYRGGIATIIGLERELAAKSRP